MRFPYFPIYQIRYLRTFCLNFKDMWILSIRVKKKYFHEKFSFFVFYKLLVMSVSYLVFVFQKSRRFSKKVNNKKRNQLFLFVFQNRFFFSLTTIEKTYLDSENYILFDFPKFGTKIQLRTKGKISFFDVDIWCFSFWLF